MPLATFETACSRIREHVDRHHLKDIALIFHGGEPLSVGPGRFRMYLDAVWSEFGPRPDVKVHVGLQTNGTLLDAAWLRLFEESPYPIGVGISLDGGAPEYNVARVDHAGHPSFESVMRSIELLRSNGRLWANTGILKVIDPFEDPRAVAGSIARLGVRRCDFLLPLLHWASLYVDDYLGYQAAMARYITSLVSWWWEQEETDLRIRTMVVWGSHFVGRKKFTDSWGLGPSHIIVIDASGSYQLTDSYKVLGNGFTQLGLDVGRPIDDVFDVPRLQYIWESARRLPDDCQGCRYRGVCGGGHMVSRYDGQSFNKRSFHCPAIYSGLTTLERLLTT
jgi:uncharacterized protein